MMDLSALVELEETSVATVHSMNAMLDRLAN
jgi:hypothetical protein